MSLAPQHAFPEPGSRKKFSPQEDANLMMLVAQLGSAAWDLIAREMAGRNARQCRERWKHYLSVGFTERPWTKAEDTLLLRKQGEFGPRWTKLSCFFQNRSDIQLKARWMKLSAPAPLPASRPPGSIDSHAQAQQDVDLLQVKQPGMLIDQMARFEQVEKKWDSLFDTTEESLFRSGSVFSWF
jgi:hypothetical protein